MRNFNLHILGELGSSCKNLLCKFKVIAGFVVSIYFKILLEKASQFLQGFVVQLLICPLHHTQKWNMEKNYSLHSPKFLPFGKQYPFLNEELSGCGSTTTLDTIMPMMN